MNIHSLPGTPLQVTDNKREQILKAAEKIVATEGLHHLSMHKLAKDAGVAAGTIYRYFVDKEQLVDEMCRNVLTEIADAILHNATSGEPKARFRTVWFNILAQRKHRTMDRLNFEQYLHLPGTDTPEYRRFEEQTFAPLLALFNDAKAQGLIIDLDNTLLFSMAFEPAIGLCRRMRRTGQDFSEAELQKICDLCWHAIAQH